MKICFLQITLLFTVVLGYSQSTTVYTCKGGAVAAYLYPEFSQQQITAANSSTMSTYAYLGITFVDNSSAQYNCHAYAWHLREGNTNKVWINNASGQTGSCYGQTHNIDQYWTDECFIQVCNESDADKVHYYCGDHSAVKSITNPGYYESKWGQLAVVRHTLTNVPYSDPVNSVHFYASTKISGDASNLCSGTRTFSVKNISGATYTWTCSATLSAVGASNTHQYVVQRNGSASGTAWVKVQISTTCSSVTATQELDFPVGPPTSIGIDVGAGGYTNMENCDATDFKVLYNATAHNYSGYLYVTASNATSLSWTVVSNSATPYWGWSTSNNGHTLYVSQSGANKYLSLNVTATNACGSINKTYTFGSNVCPLTIESTGGGDNYLLSPNPAGNNVTVSVNNAVKSSEAVSFSQILIYDGTGNLKKQLKYGSGTQQAQINVADLRPGYYYIEIGNGKTAVRKPLVVQR